MSDQLFNIRFGKRHLQITKNFKVSFRVNNYWNEVKYPCWFEVYCLFGTHFH